MRNQIIQLSFKPIMEEDYIKSDNYFDDQYVMTHVDYLSDNDDIDVDELLNNLPQGCFKYNEEDNSITLIKKPFDIVNEKIQNVIELVKTFEISNYHKISYEINKILGNGYWIDMVITIDDNIMLLNEWLFELCQDYTKLNTKFYIGGSISYRS